MANGLKHSAGKDGSFVQVSRSVEIGMNEWTRSKSPAHLPGTDLKVCGYPTRPRPPWTSKKMTSMEALSGMHTLGL